MRRLSTLSFLLFCYSLQHAELTLAQSGKELRRQALIIGNKNYPDAPLSNSGNDAQDVAAALRRLGFEVTLLLDGTGPQLEDAVDEFTAALGPESLGLLFFAGHGVRVDGLNYMLPVDFDAKSERGVKYEAYPADRAREQMEDSGAPVNILILDMCRNNPFSRSWSRSLGQSGLGTMRQVKGTLVMFATGPGETASDNPGERNGLFTKYLLENLERPGQEIKQVFQQVREDVYTASNETQFPWLSDGLLGTYYLKPDTSSPEKSATQVRSGIESAQATLKLFCLQGACEVRINGKSLGSTTEGAILTLPLPAGSLQLEVFKAGYHRHSERLELFPGQEKSLHLKLERNLELGDRESVQLPGGESLELVWVPAGSFLMGCSPGDTHCDENESPRHRVAVEGFWMGRFEVTQAQWESVMGEDRRKVLRDFPAGEGVPLARPSYFGQCGKTCPIESVGYYDAQEFLKRSGLDLRLPTEEEWEYAARAGSTESTYGPLEQVAWYYLTSDATPHPVGKKQPNAFGLFDMLGNVWEWTSNAPITYSYDSTGKPYGPVEHRIFRGGCWSFLGNQVRLSDRAHAPADFRGYNVGFRVARSVP